MQFKNIYKSFSNLNFFQMKRLLSFAVCLCTLMLALSSCSNNNDLVGKWEQNVDQYGLNAYVTYDFKEDGTLTQTFEMKSPQMNIVGEGSCKYTYKDGEITFKFSASDFNFSEFEIEGVDSEYIDMVMEEMKSQIANVEEHVTDVKIDGDKLTGNSKGQKIQLTRVK